VELVIIDHARLRMAERGASEDDVRHAIETGRAEPQRAGRWAKEAVFPYNADWQGRRYEQKKVRAVYVEEGARVVVVTVYVYYGRWEDR
jgi:hypothetical protein